MRLADYIGGEHRRIEEALEALTEALREGDAAALERFRAVWRLAEPHLRAEEGALFPALRPGFERLVLKMEDQHAQVREAATAFEVAAGSGSADLFPLGRRFHALLQHHLIEEERDLVALAGRFLEAPLQLELIEALRSGDRASPHPGR